MTITKELTLVNKYGMHVRPAGALAKVCQKYSCDVTVQNAASKKAEKLAADYPAVEHVRIVFDEEGHKYVVSLAVQGGQKTTVGATAKDADATAALNAVFDKANAQLRRASKKRQEVRK